MPRYDSIQLRLIEKRDELIFALDYQGYNGQDIAKIFNLNRSTIKRILSKKPLGWKPKWHKVV